MHINADALLDALRDKGLRITEPRRAVCEVIASAHDDHLTAASIHRRAASRSPMDESTVYRTLEALEAAGLVAHSHMGHGPSVYHLAEEASHTHLVCDSCGATISIPDDEFERLLEGITRATGFVASSRHFAIGGSCGSCAEVEQRARG